MDPNRRILSDTAIAAEEGEIKRNHAPADKVLRAEGKAVLPGPINRPDIVILHRETYKLVPRTPTRSRRNVRC